MAEIIFISGIDTDAGKSYATGHLANMLSAQGKRVITQKFIQTGCTEESEDIILHRKIMGLPMLDDDTDHTTAPVIFSYPASAQLAAAMDGRTIELDAIDRATASLASRYDVVLIEGAGGLMVPITDDFFAIDYAQTRNIPISLVTNSRLGSINHTILSLEAIKNRGIKLHSILYNRHFDNDAAISADTRAFVGRYVAKHSPETEIIDIPSINI